MTPPTSPRGANWTARRDTDGWYVADSNGVEVCCAPSGDAFSQGDAEYIARVCNAHAPLVDALAGLIEVRTAEDCAELDGPVERWLTARQIEDRWAAARTALALARNGVAP